MEYAIAVIRAWLGSSTGRAVRYNGRASSGRHVPGLTSGFRCRVDGRVRIDRPVFHHPGLNLPQLISRPVGFKRL